MQSALDSLVSAAIFLISNAEDAEEYDAADNSVVNPTDAEKGVIVSEVVLTIVLVVGTITDEDIRRIEDRSAECDTLATLLLTVILEEECVGK